MIRSMKLAALAAALGLGTGCGLFDEYSDDSRPTGAPYQEDGLPAPHDVGSYQPSGLPPVDGPAPAAPQSGPPAGVYQPGAK